MVELPNSNDSQLEAWPNMLRWGARYRQLDNIGDTPAAAPAWRAFQRCWLRNYGTPEVIVTDGAPEFRGEFAEKAVEHGIFQHVTDFHDPW